ncbi:leucine zipper domain-containing protein [Subtercola lobariae]|uniref:leucine zipper domain-containing protein n=1 Tax=Subtercola lobariae TaxID=1588641 RepID=UPI00227A70CE|nr:leucine zipper domain-containing protein [Subtercola lobariae]
MSHVTHPNASLTPAGRLKLVELVVEDGWVQARAAERFQVSRATVSKWVRRYRAHGRPGLTDASSRPHRSPARTPRRTERRILALRFSSKDRSVLGRPVRFSVHRHSLEIADLLTRACRSFRMGIGLRAVRGDK